ncbi:MAG: patatin-like phospholipase family protein [Deltaproteobacteria bacterium]|nr:patatin-like phospholipase family protein [Deltaproteobacteria bacterium]
MTRPTLSQWLASEPFALAMSSGFFGFFAHCGVLAALEQEGLTPSAVSGSSAGALVTGAWASGLDAHALADALTSLRREDFWDVAPGFGLLRGALFRNKLEALLPVPSFARCRVPLTLSVFDVRTRSTHVLHDGLLAPAIHASCALPLLFQPVKYQGSYLLDGGVLDRAGLQGLTDHPRVLHHHLSSRSAWRRPNSPALIPPQREGLVALVIDGLERSGPFRLANGARILESAQRAAERALRSPVRDGLVRLSA